MLGLDGGAPSASRRWLDAPIPHERLKGMNSSRRFANAAVW
jgi:hypothetical protein